MRRQSSRLARGLLIPAGIYSLFTVIYTWPWLPRFGNQLYALGGDAHQNVWNLWWFDHAITTLHQSPFFTTVVHYPEGTSLVAQTLSPLNGILGLGLLRVMDPVQVYNSLVLLSFVTAGLAAFHLCWAITSKYVPALVGGFVFTFSTYHFAHAYGHLNLVTIQLIPVFLLAWRALLLHPTYLRAVVAALVLFLVSLCDLNFMLYCVIAGAVMLLFPRWRASLAELGKPLAAFVVTTLATTAVLPVALFITTRRAGVSAGHAAGDYPADPFLVALGGGLGRFDLLTGWAWDHLSGLGAPERADLGLLVVGILAIAVLKPRYRNIETPMWIAMTVVFLVFAIGPRLVLASRHLPVVPFPYSALGAIPGVALSGVPVRMVLMAGLAAAVVVATVLGRIIADGNRWAVVVFALVLIVLSWPISQPTSSDEPSRYVSALRATKDRDPVLDLAAGEVVQLFNQTFDEHPRALGYLTRTFPDVHRRRERLLRDVRRERFDRVCQTWGLRYVTMTSAAAATAQLDAPELYRDGDAVVFDLDEPFGPCVVASGA